MPDKRALLVPLALVGFAGLCYGSIVRTYFVSDDFFLIGSILRDGLSFKWCFQSGGYLRPVTVLSYLVDHRLWGFNPVGYHLTNVLFHGLTAYALLFCALRLFTKLRLAEPRLAAGLTASLFVALPCHAEAVSWISGRTDVIAVALGLAATVCFLSLLEERSLLRALLAPTFLAAALLTKECVIVLPFIWCALFVHDWRSRKERPSVHSVIVLALSCLLLAAYFFLRKATIGYFIGGLGTQLHISILKVSSLVSLSQFSLRTFLPALPTWWPTFTFAAGCAAGAFASIFVYYWRRLRRVRWSFVALLVTCYVFSLIPVINIGVRPVDTRGERLLYLPSAFACVLLVYLVTVCIPSSRRRTVAIIVLIAAQAATLQWINRRWIAAAHVSKQIATEVSRFDPAKTLILNVPENLRGIYVYRLGLSEAATTFLGIRRQTPYRIISWHCMKSMDDVFEAKQEGGTVTLVLPSVDRFYLDLPIEPCGLNVSRTSTTLTVGDGPETKVRDLVLLSFRTAREKPMLRVVGLEPTTDSAPHQ